MKATDQQIQDFVNTRVRPRAEQIRALLRSMQDDIASIDDVYQALAGASTWGDARPDGPPHLLVGSDVLAWNTFINDLVTAMTGNAQLPVVLKACVRPLA